MALRNAAGVLPAGTGVHAGASPGGELLVIGATLEASLRLAAVGVTVTMQLALLASLRMEGQDKKKYRADQAEDDYQTFQERRHRNLTASLTVLMLIPLSLGRCDTDHMDWCTQI